MLSTNQASRSLFVLQMLLGRTERCPRVCLAGGPPFRLVLIFTYNQEHKRVALDKSEGVVKSVVFLAGA